MDSKQIFVLLINFYYNNKSNNKWNLNPYLLSKKKKCSKVENEFKSSKSAKPSFSFLAPAPQKEEKR